MQDKLEQIYNFLTLDTTPTKADAIICFGSNDISVAQYAAELFLQGFADIVVFSGGVGRGTEGFFAKPEAEYFAEIAINMGVSKKAIYIENKSTNTGENIAFTKQLLISESLKISKALFVQKPYMQKRLNAALSAQWSEIDFTVVAPNYTYNEYIEHIKEINVPQKTFTDMMIGDLQRFDTYYKQGYQTKIEVPLELLNFR